MSDDKQTECGHLDSRLPERLVLLWPLQILADKEGGEGPSYGQPHQDTAAAQALQSGAEHCDEHGAQIIMPHLL